MQNIHTHKLVPCTRLAAQLRRSVCECRWRRANANGPSGGGSTWNTFHRAARGSEWLVNCLGCEEGAGRCGR